MGKLIVFEGNECSGKTTVIHMVKEKLLAAGYSVFCTREPGGTQAGEDIRSIILDREYPQAINGRTEALLYAASRSEMLEKVLIPNLDRYDFVLMDRYYYSSLVYQGVVRGLGQFAYDVNRLFIEQYPPDLAIFLDITSETRIQRLSRRTDEQNRLDREPLEFLARVDDAYHDLVDRMPEMVSVDANGELVGIVDTCFHKILDLRTKEE